MPSAMVGNNAVQSAFPDLGNGSNSETMKQVLGVIDKKVRNMEKKKVSVVNQKLKCDVTIFSCLIQSSGCFLIANVFFPYDVIISFTNLGEHK